MSKRSYVLPDKRLTDSGAEVKVELSGIELAADSELAQARDHRQERLL